MVHLPIWNLHREKEIFKRKIGPKYKILSVLSERKLLGQLLRFDRQLESESEN